jgi:hypothetical protein
MILKLEVHADVMAESFYKQHLITGLLCRSVVLKQKPLTHRTSVVSYLGHWENIFSVQTLDLVVTYTYFSFQSRKGVPSVPVVLGVTVTRLTVPLLANVKLAFLGMVATVQVSYILYLISYDQN